MRPLRFACLFVIFISAMMLAQSNPFPSVDEPPINPNFFRTSRGLPSARHRHGYEPGTRRSQSSQASGLNFAPALVTGTGGISEWEAVADVNGDEKPDVVVTSYCYDCSVPSEVVTVMFGNGDGTFSGGASYGTGGFSSNGAAAVADVNGDGKPDIVVLNQCSDSTCTSSSVGVLLGNGDGTFQTAVPYGSGGISTFSVTVADVNGDGKLDLIMTNLCTTSCTTSFVSVLLGNGDGTFQSPINSSNVAGAMAVEDVNGDGKPDLVVGSNGVSVLLGNGDGTFQTAVSYGSGGSNAYSVAVVDVNGDGKLDLLVANGIGVGVLLGNGDGTFKTAVTYGSGANTLAVADVNGDGKLDLSVTGSDSSGTSTAGVLLGNGDGTFQTMVTFDAGGENGGEFPVDIVAADVSGDGKPDLLVVNVCVDFLCEQSSGSGVSVLINISTYPTATALSSSANPSAFGQSVTFTATVTQQFGKGTPTGTVTFLDGTTNLGSPTLSNSGVATLTISTLAVGTHSITATYNGDSNFGSSTSPVLSQVVQEAIALLSPTNLNFGNQTVGDGQGYQTVTLTNTGNIALTITSIAVNLSNGGYAQINTCGTSVAAGASCTYSLTWNPAKAGSMTGSITFTDSSPGSPQVVSLSGVGVTPTVSLSPASLAFATQVVFTTSAAQTVTLSNTGLGILTISKIAVTGQFTQTNTCGSQVAAGGSCIISVKFKPTTSGTLTGSVSITDNASGSPQKIALSGTGTDIQLTPTSLNFGNQPVGTKSLAKKITLSNKASVSVSITSISVTGTNKGDFAETNTCGTTVKAGASCSITVTFTPAAKGKRTASVSVSDNGGGSPQTVALSGTGT
jgi:hypothetical protein